MAGCTDPTSALVALVLSGHIHKKPLWRPRGRSAGSRNMPKPPIIIAGKSPSSLRAHAVEVISGCDISDCIMGFARGRQYGVCILSANVTLRQPASSSPVTLHGRFEILTLLGSFFPPPTPVALTGITVYLAGAQGLVVGSSVVGNLIAPGPIVTVAMSFMNASLERLPAAAVDEDIYNGECEQHCRRPMNQTPLPLMHGSMYGVPPEIYRWLPPGHIAKG